MSETSKIDRNEITNYILKHNFSLTLADLQCLSIGQLVLLKVQMQIKLDKNK